MLLFLNDDVEVIEEGWLKELVTLAIREDVGSVGALLYYGNGTIQHAGVLLVDYGGGALHLFRQMTPGTGIHKRLDCITREVSANTGACLMVTRQKFNQLGGFDETLTIVGNDVDFCLRLQQLGYRNLWTPACKLLHHESVSRKEEVNESDRLNLWNRWRNTFLTGDPYYHPNLSRLSGNCSPNLKISNKILASQFHAPKTHPLQIPEQLPCGVNVFGYIRADMGLGEGARSYARALEANQTNFCIINFETGNPTRMTDLSWMHKEASEPVYNVNLININADHLPNLRHEMPDYFFKNQYNIGCWTWELPDIPADWYPAFQYVDEVWAPSEFVKVALEKIAPCPVFTIPYSIHVEPECDLSRQDFNLPENTFLFLAMFDTRSVAERKNPYGAVEAFQKTFKSDDTSIRLVLKVNNAAPATLIKLNALIKGWNNIILQEQEHSRKQINALISLCDCFVSLHRAEGFGLGPAEAMCLGKPVILTNWSGNLDYMTPENCIPIAYNLVEIDSDYGPYKKGQVWAEPRLDLAAEAMRKLKEDPIFAKQIGDKGRQTIMESFSPLAVGKKMESRLKQIQTLLNKN
jgi:glycosyltransferase involved in cell wall biosynthesis